MANKDARPDIALFHFLEVDVQLSRVYHTPPPMNQKKETPYVPFFLTTNMYLLPMIPIIVISIVPLLVPYDCHCMYRINTCILNSPSIQ